MLSEPLNRKDALLLAQKILKEGSTVPTQHGEERMDERELTMVDVQNVIERGRIDREPEQNEHGRWSYRIETYAMVVVVAFRSETEMKIVTAWRKS